MVVPETRLLSFLNESYVNPKQVGVGDLSSNDYEAQPESYIVSHCYIEPRAGSAGLMVAEHLHDVQGSDEDVCE